MCNILITMKNGDTMEAELYPEIAPITVENFLKLIDKKFFDGTVFHRIIKGFMIQGGGYTEDGEHKPCDSIKGEFTANGFINNLKHEKGVLSMARTSFPNSASSQFFIMHEAAPHLDGQYAAFGKVTKGLDVVDKIASVKTNFVDSPLEPQVIESIRVIK